MNVAPDTNVLVVCDNRPCFGLVSSFLNQHVKKKYLANDMWMAFEILKHHKIDVTILNKNVSGMRDFELLQKINRLYPEVINIVVSKSAEEKELVRAVQLHAYEFVTMSMPDDIWSSKIKKGLNYSFVKKKLNNVNGELNRKNIILNEFTEVSKKLMSIMKKDDQGANVSNSCKNCKPVLNNCSDKSSAYGLWSFAHDNYKNLVKSEIGLTPSELMICRLVMSDYLDKQMADELNVSVGTVKTHKRSIRRKLGISKTGQNLKIFLLDLTQPSDKNISPASTSISC